MTYDESVVKTESLIEAVTKTGYSATVLDEKDTQFETKKESWKLKIYLISLSLV